MRLTHAIIAYVATLLLAACSTIEMPETEPNGIVESEDGITLTVSLDVPRMAAMQSRAMGMNPDYTDLHLYLLEFERNSDNPLENFYVRSYEADAETPAASPAPEHVDFTVTLNKTTTGRVLHLIAVPKGVAINVNEPLSEGLILPTLTTTGGNEAYWQRVDFPQGYGTQTGDGQWQTLPEVAQKLTMVPMVRNFASVEVKSATEDFEVEGFFLTNTASHGSVAPWNQAQGNFPTYLTAADNSQLDYTTLSSTYKGLLPAKASIDDVTAGYTDDRFQNAPLYIYELPYNSAKPAQLLIKGKYKGGNSSYYKIDLGRVNSQTNIFEPYNLLRNIAYTVNIKSASASGYNTINAALNGATYNNLSFDVNTQRMLNISDGQNMLQVSFTTAVVTENTSEARTLRFGYRYRKNISSGSPTTANDEIKFNGREAGTAISSVTAFGENDADGWCWCDITTNAPTTETRTQSFTLIDKTGKLARTINIVVREPWEITRNVAYAGTYNLPKDFPNEFPERRHKAAVGEGAEVTVFFTIPENLPQAIFPLQFVLESDLQNVENNPIGTLFVTSGKSFFSGVNEQDFRIKYVKTVTWADYHTELDSLHPTGTIVPLTGTIPAGSPKHVHRIRARLKTLTKGTDNNITEGTTTIRIDNPYFCLGEPDDPSAPDYNDLAAPTVGTKGGVVEVTFTRDSGLNLDGTKKK